MNFPQVIDANLNRAAEGLRVIEEYTRFIAGHQPLSQALAVIRKAILAQCSDQSSLLNSRDTNKDMRAKEAPPKRAELSDLLAANFKRVTQALRVLEEYTGNPQFNQYRYDCYDLEKQICLRALKPVIKPGIYLISDDVSVLKQGVDWGVQLIQLRDKDGDKKQRYEKALALSKYAKGSQTLFIVNDDVDIAMLVDASGVHVGQNELGTPAIRSLIGPHKIIGRTTHSLEQGQAAAADGADYVSVGPLWETPSKPGREGIGLSYLKEVSASLSLPFVAIGGIDESRAESLLPYQPYLIGLIRHYKAIPKLQKMYKKTWSSLETRA